ARARRPAGAVLPREIHDDALAELSFVVQHVVGDREPPRRLPGGPRGRRRTAGAEARDGIVGRFPWRCPEGNSDDLLARLAKEGGGNGAVNTPTESYNDGSH